LEPWQLPFHEWLEHPRALNVPRGSILAMHPDQVTEEWLMRRSVDDLAILARVYGAPHSGTRKDLIGRILTWKGLRELLADEDVESLQCRKNADLKAMLKSVGAFAGLNKYGMASALIGWREESRRKGRSFIARMNHYRHVCRAVRLGLDVPANVLVSYPDLQEHPGDMPLFSAPKSERSEV
jgi:hypothetical protein